MPSMQPLIGSILERKPLSSPAPPAQKSAGSTKTGFPTAQHRSKSAFARAREEKQNGKDRPLQIPVVQAVAPAKVAALSNGEVLNGSSAEDWRRQVEEENQRRVEAMTEEEREEERREILQRFGPGVVEILRKAREAKDRGAKAELPAEEGIVQPAFPVKTEHHVSDVKPSRPPTRPSTPPSALSTNSTRPSSRADRKLRFAEVTPNDVHVYESAPSSPRKKPLALPPPSDDDGAVIHLGEWKSKASPSVRRRDSPFTMPLKDLDEGTPEDIRRRFFPQAPANDPSLEWIENIVSPEQESAPTLRFDFTGTPIPPALSSTLPTHLGLHHHADAAHAGYSLEDVFMLSRSTVPGQRASMLGVLARIARRLARGLRGDTAERIDQLVGQENELRQRILAAGVEALSERGSLGARAVEVIWECIVGWDEEVITVEGVELQEPGKADSSSTTASSPSTAGNDPISSLPLDFVLPQISSAIGTVELPPESLSQLLAIVHRLAQHTKDIAASIVTTPGLVANIVQTFLLTPIPPTEGSSLPDPAALQVLITLTLASRTNANALLGPADVLLRFVTALPPASPFPTSLATSLLAGTLRLYAAFAGYGLYAHIATTAATPLADISAYVLSFDCHSRQLQEAWLALLEAWMVCARDPHRTAPAHEILWSQVVGRGWDAEVLQMRERLGEGDESVWEVLWRAEAAWLEGARVNAVRSGEEERAGAVDAVRDGFASGVEHGVVEDAGRRLEDALRGLGASGAQVDVQRLRAAAAHASTLAAAVRFWLSCLPSQTQGPLSAPPFSLPFAQLSALCANITSHPLWSAISSGQYPSYTRVFCRPLSLLLSYYLQLSRRMPGTSDDLWLAQSFAILCRLLPGDEEFAQHVVSEMAELVTPGFMEQHGWSVPAVLWEKGGMQPINPFLSFPFHPQQELYVAPAWMSSPQSISQATTQWLPVVSKSPRDCPLPLTRDWIFCPLDQLLRSGQSDVFKSLPSSWNYSEIEVVRATLLFAKINRELLRLHGLTGFQLSREETIFAGMKVFMLEHEQEQNDSTEEVFRDAIVGQYLEDLFTPFTASASPTSLLVPPPLLDPQDSLEAIATRFLGPSTPFYQYYTDFVSLYDAISFAHPLFARLLLPPLAMRFPVDFRKYLWADYTHVLRTLRTPVDAVITGSVGEFLYPLEADAHVLAAYLRALVTVPLEGFVRLVAIHHIACNIWPDLRNTHEPEENARKLLMAVIDQGGFEVVREVVLYRQAREGTLLLPPACFAQMGGWKASRLEFVERCGGLQLRERLKKLLE